MTKEVIHLRENITLISASDQAKHPLKSLKKEFDNTPDYFAKKDDISQINTILAAVESYLKDRHLMIHSTLTSKSGGSIIIRKNRRTSIEDEVSSKEIFELVKDLYELQTQIDGLKFPVQRLISILS